MSLQSRIEKAAVDFDNNGYGVVEDFLTVEEITRMKAEMRGIVDKMNPDEHPCSVFVTDDPDQHVSDKYFMESVDKIRFFYESDAVDPKTGKLIVDKQQAFNKVGHAIHWLSPVFRQVSFSDKIKQIMRAINYEKPAICQGMYIFKHAKIGGPVTPHYDGTFLQADPIDNSMGLWCALDDATLENGCLWFAPGSHKDNPADYRFDRSNGKLEFHGNSPDYDSKPFVATPVKAGSVVLIHSLVWHKSAGNTSEKERHAFTLHIGDKGRNTKWLPQNWLQETSDYKFPLIFDN